MYKFNLGPCHWNGNEICQDSEPSKGIAGIAPNAPEEWGPVFAAASSMLAILEELENTFDEQTYIEKARENFDAPDDREYSVNITAKQLRAISAALSKTEGKE